jgi:hypothetical protein
MEIDDNKQLKPLDQLTITKIQMKNERILDSASSSSFFLYKYSYLLLFSLCCSFHISFYVFLTFIFHITQISTVMFNF